MPFHEFPDLSVGYISDDDSDYEFGKDDNDEEDEQTDIATAGLDNTVTTGRLDDQPIWVSDASDSDDADFVPRTDAELKMEEDMLDDEVEGPIYDRLMKMTKADLLLLCKRKPTVVKLSAAQQRGTKHCIVEIFMSKHSSKTISKALQ